MTTRLLDAIGLGLALLLGVTACSDSGGNHPGSTASAASSSALDVTLLLGRWKAVDTDPPSGLNLATSGVEFEFKGDGTLEGLTSCGNIVRAKWAIESARNIVVFSEQSHTAIGCLPGKVDLFDFALSARLDDSRLNVDVPQTHVGNAQHVVFERVV
jgi:hypothetical protein